jgi:hypothetical protein
VRFALLFAPLFRKKISSNPYKYGYASQLARN